MTADEKLAAILAAVQTDPGNRGLGRVPGDNLFTACPGDFAAACRSIAGHLKPAIRVVTGFFIPTADPPSYETDGPLGSVFLWRALEPLGIPVEVIAENEVGYAVSKGLGAAGVEAHQLHQEFNGGPFENTARVSPGSGPLPHDFLVALERVGPATDHRCYTMRGIDVSERMGTKHAMFLPETWRGRRFHTIGIGDGGNEIGMGKVPHETIVANIPNGDLIHCRVPTDYLIVAGVSNWGAYALAAGVYALRGIRPAADVFDPDRELAILRVMVRKGPLVDGVTGKQTATVDGLPWEEYAKPLVRIREILDG